MSRAKVSAVALVFLLSAVGVQAQPAGQALRFSTAEGDVVTVPGLAAPADYTLSAWVRYEGDEASYPTILSFDGKPWVGLSEIGDYPEIWAEGTYTLLWSNGPIASNNWVHVAFTKQGNVHAIFVNGVQDGSEDWSGYSVATNGTDLIIGGDLDWGPTYSFEGLIDEVMVWDHARSAAQIQADMGGYAAAQPGMTAYFRFEDVGGQQATNLVGAPHGTYGTTAGSETTDPTPEGTPLPVELVSVDAIAAGSDVLLRWQTASETNNAGFDIERAAGDTWERVGFAAGHGTTAESQSYEHRVGDLSAGLHRFRLKQIDFDGAFAYSPEVEVTVGVAGTHQLSGVYPNPFGAQTHMTLAVQTGQHVRVTVFDALGRQVVQLFEGWIEGGRTQRFTFDGTGLTSGLYVLRAQGETFQETRNLVLAR